MEFEVSTTGYFYDDENVMQKLQKLWFTFRYSDNVKRWGIEGKGKVIINSIQNLIIKNKKYDGKR